MIAVSGVTATTPNPGRNSWAGWGRCLLVSSIHDIVLVHSTYSAEMSRADSAELAGRAKKTNNSHCPALRRGCRGEAAPSGEAA